MGFGILLEDLGEDLRKLGLALDWMLSDSGDNYLTVYLNRSFYKEGRLKEKAVIGKVEVTYFSPKRHFRGVF